MIPIISIPTVQTQATVSSAFVVSAPSEVAIGRLPFQSVAASIAAPEVNNNSRGNPQPRTQPSVSEAVANSSSSGLSQIAAPTLESGRSTPGFSSLFLAQLFGQKNVIQDGSLMQSFLGSFSPSQTIDYNTMIAFSRTKYKPSNAAVPRLAESSQPIVSAATQAPSEPSLRDQLVQQRQINQNQQQAVQSAPTVPNIVKQFEAAASAPAVTYATTPVKEKAPVQAKVKQAFTTESLIRTPQGLGSYMATAARNTLNLMTNTTPQYEMVL